MWCRQQSVNHQELLCSLHCATTVVLREQLNFKSAVIRYERSSCLLRTKPIFALNACAEQQALVSTTYQVEDTFHTRSDTNAECLSLRYNPNKSYTCVLVFSSFCVEWPRLPLGHIVSWTSNHATCHVYWPKAVETIVLVLNFNFTRGDRC